MNYLCATAIAALLALGTADATPNASSQPSHNLKHYQTSGLKPCIVLLYHAAADQEWTGEAEKLAGRFDVILIDVSEFAEAEDPIQSLRKRIATLNLDRTRIAGSAHGETLALRYALTYPQHSQSFTLPHSSEDLQLLTALINSTPFDKS